MNKNTQNKKLNILVILPHSIGGRLTTSSISDGFVQNNCNVTKFDELKQPLSELKTLLKSSRFDFIVGYDFSALKIKYELNLQIKTINYFSDEIDKPTAGVGFKELRKYLNDESNFTFYWDKELFLEEKKNFKNIFYQPHFVNTDIYKPIPTKIKYDVMFAGRLDTDYRLNFIVELAKEYNFAWFAIEKHYIDALNRVNEEDKKVIQNCYKEFIDNESDMAQAINSSKIVINMHSQGKSSFNYRTFQTMACAKLLLSEYRREAAELFGEKDLVFYKDLTDIKEKISHYLYNEVDYNEVIKNARARIESDFNSKKCVNNMLQIVQNKI